MQQAPGPMIQARLACRNGIWQGPDGHRPDGHRIDEVESGAGVPQGATDGSPPERRPCRTVARTAAARWDSEPFGERILEKPAPPPGLPVLGAKHAGHLGLPAHPRRQPGLHPQHYDALGDRGPLPLPAGGWPGRGLVAGRPDGGCRAGSGRRRAPSTDPAMRRAASDKSRRP